MAKITLTLQDGFNYQGDHIYMPAGSAPLEVELTELLDTTLSQLLWLGNCRHVFKMTISDMDKIEEEICNRRG